jgi:hypothetical protein
MKMWKPCILGVVFVVVIGFLAIRETYAQPPDMSQWVGKWFRLKSTQKGITFNPSDSNFLKNSEVGIKYMKIWNWDPNNKDFRSDIYFQDLAVWKAQTMTFRFLAGTDVKFILLFFWLRADFVEETSKGQAITVIMEGKQKNGILQGANVNTLGGGYVLVDAGSASAGSFSLIGKMIDVSKVPVPADTIIQH